MTWATGVRASPRRPPAAFSSCYTPCMNDRPSLTFAARARSFGYAFRGVRVLVVTQPNAWIHAVATVLVCALGLSLGLSAAEWCWIVLAMAAVWTAEALNTAIESLTDLVSPNHHPLAGQAKDVAAAGVLIAAFASVVIGVLVLGPHVWRAVLLFGVR